MKPTKQTITEGTVGDWIPVTRNSENTKGFTVRPHTNSGGTYDVNFTESDLQGGTKRPVSRSSTTLTITWVDHGLTTDDDVVLTESIDYDGVYRVASVPDQNSLTVTVAASGTARFAKVAGVVVDTLTNLSAVSGLNSGNIFGSVSAVRVDATNVTTQPVDIIIDQY